MPPQNSTPPPPPAPEERGPVADAVITGVASGAASAIVAKVIQGKQPPKDK